MPKITNQTPKLPPLGPQPDPAANPDTASLSPAEAAAALPDWTGFYSRVLATAESLDFETAASAQGLDSEITLMRVKIKSVLENDPDNLKLVMQAADILIKLVKARYSMNKKQGKKLGEAIKDVIKDIGVPLGVAIINRKL
jgi:hypothetical protein